MRLALSRKDALQLVVLTIEFLRGGSHPELPPGQQDELETRSLVHPDRDPVRGSAGGEPLHLLVGESGKLSRPVRFGRASEQTFTWITLPLQMLTAGIWLYGLGVFFSAALNR